MVGSASALPKPYWPALRCAHLLKRALSIPRRGTIVTARVGLSGPLPPDIFIPVVELVDCSGIAMEKKMAYNKLPAPQGCSLSRDTWMTARPVGTLFTASLSYSSTVSCVTNDVTE